MAARWDEARRDGRCSHCKAPFTAGDEIYIKAAGVYLGRDCGCGTLAENMTEDVGRMEASILKELASLPLEAAEGVIAQSMLNLARDLDAGDVPPRERPQYTKELRISLLTLKDAYPASEDEDETEEARRKRERRARESGGF